MARVCAISRVAAVILFFCAEASLCPAAPQSKPKTPAKAPAADPALIDQKGFRGLLERYRGKPLLVNFWATWCQPCHTEYPIINELARQYAPQGLVVLGISFDEDAEINLVRHFLERNRPIFHNYRKRPGEEMAFARSVNPGWNGTIPATFFYSRDGRELAHFVGTRSRAEFEIAIREVLETKTNSPGH